MVKFRYLVSVLLLLPSLAISVSNEYPSIFGNDRCAKHLLEIEAHSAKQYETDAARGGLYQAHHIIEYVERAKRRQFFLDRFHDAVRNVKALDAVLERTVGPEFMSLPIDGRRLEITSVMESLQHTVEGDFFDNFGLVLDLLVYMPPKDEEMVDLLRVIFTFRVTLERTRAQVATELIRIPEGATPAELERLFGVTVDKLDLSIGFERIFFVEDRAIQEMYGQRDVKITQFLDMASGLRDEFDGETTAEFLLSFVEPQEPRGDIGVAFGEAVLDDRRVPISLRNEVGFELDLSINKLQSGEPSLVAFAFFLAVHDYIVLSTNY